MALKSPEPNFKNILDSCSIFQHITDANFNIDTLVDLLICFIKDSSVNHVRDVYLNRPHQNSGSVTSEPQHTLIEDTVKKNSLDV